MNRVISMLEKWSAGVQTYLRTCEEDPSVSYYGVGCSGHWSVQSSMNVLSALACLGVEKGDRKLIDQALSLFRYAMRTHEGVGKLGCVNDGKQWGCHWISCLGPERMAHGINALRPYMNEEDLRLLKTFCRLESDWLLDHYEVVAGPLADSGRNKPESNIWNGGFLFRTAMDYPDLPRKEEYLEKATRFLLNGLSIAEDALSDALFRGKPLREWHAGANFLPGWSLDHHRYMNVGYSFVSLSNIAMLHYNFRERGQTPPACLYHHVSDLWQVLKHFLFADGRMLRLGGDSRVRYTYCQDFELPVLTFAADHLHDPEAGVMESRLIELIRREQEENPSGMFFEKRLSSLKNESYYWYTRLESDPALVLGQVLHWHRLFDLPLSPADGKIELNPAYSWSNDYHGACLLRKENSIRSVCHSTLCGPQTLCTTASASDLAEWQGQLSCEAEIGLAGFHAEMAGHVIHPENDRFRSCSLTILSDPYPKGEGETPSSVVAVRHAVCALPDGHTMVILDHAEMLREFSVNHVYPLHWLIPNDVYNGKVRHWKGEDFEQTLHAYPEQDLRIDTRSRILSADDVLTLGLVYGGDSLEILHPARQIIHAHDKTMLTSLYAETVTVNPVMERTRPRKGTCLADTGCWITAGVPRERALEICGTPLPLSGMLRGIRIRDLNGTGWEFIANFGKDAASVSGTILDPGDTLLRKV